VPSDELHDPRLSRALGHPLRLRLLDVIIEASEASPVALSRQLKVPLATVSRHVRVLRDLGYVELTRTEPRRGAVEHFYRATRVPFIDDAEWVRLPLALRRGLSHQTFRTIFAEASAGGGAGGFDAPGAAIARLPLQLDETGRLELSDAVARLFRDAEAIRERSEVRQSSPAGSRGPVTAMRLAALLFAVPDSSSPSAPATGSPKQPRRRPRLP
jgi:DNA-binding transcriptional ArsR family regulator